MRHLLLLAPCLLLPAVPLVAGESAKAPKAPLLEDPAAAPSRNHFRISAGWMWREIGDVRFVSGSRSRFESLPSLFGRPQSHPAAVGPPNAYGERRYRDGYVGVDAGTANDGATSFWGYNHSSQVSGDEIRFQANGSSNVVESRREVAPEAAWEEDGGGHAPVIQLDWGHDLSPALTLGFQAGWSLLQTDSAHRNSDFSAWQRSGSFHRSVTDTYNLRGIIVPQAPYAGAGLGFGPLLDNIPASRSSRDTAGPARQAHYFNDLHQSLDLNLNTLSLGPTAAFRANRFEFQAAAGLALNIASWDADHRETLYLSRNGGKPSAVKQWSSHASDTDILPGFYLQGGAGCQLTPRLSLHAIARYDWSDKLEGSAGPSTFSVDLSGWSAGVVLGFRF
jgi:hypothetical protein